MSKNLLVIGTIWPEPASTAAGSRMIQIIEVFQENGFQITFASTAIKTDRSFPLEKHNIITSRIQLNNSNFDSFILKINPAVVLFDRFITEEQFGWRVSEKCPEALRILDTEDLHFLRNARRRAYKNKESINLKYLINDITKREIASIYRCDLSLIISKFEFELLVDTFKIESNLLMYLPFLMDELKSELTRSYPTFEMKQHFMSIGNFKHMPNWNAVLELKNNVWPLIRKKLPEVEIHIYGAYTTEKVNQLHNEKEGFIIKGWVQQSEYAFKKARVCLAPIQFGAGLKGKLLEAMQYGTPSVTTPVGSEAMHAALDWNGYICDNSKIFSEKAIQLYTDKEIWIKANQNGFKIINQCYSKKEFSKCLIDRIQVLQKDLIDKRLENFIGSMLQHHSMQSTKYLSKWIEEKAKN